MQAPAPTSASTPSRRQFLAAGLAAVPMAATLSASDPTRLALPTRLPRSPNCAASADADQHFEIAPDGRAGELRAEVVEIEPTAAAPISQPSAVAHSGRARVAILAGVYEWWAPRNWRSVPDHGAVAELSEPMSFRAARERAKWFNQDRRLHASEWAVVIASDGRQARGGAA